MGYFLGVFRIQQSTEHGEESRYTLLSGILLPAATIFYSTVTLTIKCDWLNEISAPHGCAGARAREVWRTCGHRPG
ncbi:MAG: hypothetical protein WBG40_10995, partial [Candidatus Sulfotelmatobacter sp.]